MPVNTPSAEYEEMIDKWIRCRDAFDGSDAIKGGATKYLPKTERQEALGTGYTPYLKRAVWYPAMERTVTALNGAVFQKPPDIKYPAKMIEKHAEDITLAGETLEEFARRVGAESLITGRYGVLIDMSSKESSTNRPYWIQYRAEDIISVRRERMGGDEVVTRVILKECEEVPDDKDAFKTVTRDRYRVLELGGSTRDKKGGFDERFNSEGEPIYVSTIWRKVSDKEDDYQPGEPEIPMRAGKPLTFIPFIVPDMRKPPLLDMVDMNIALYRNSADYENGLYFVGQPFLWGKGMLDEDGNLSVGAKMFLEVEPENGHVGLIQVDGDSFGALKEAMDEKKKDIAALGARILEEQPRSTETATAVRMRHSGEHASLKDSANAISADLTTAVKIHAWWVSTEKDFNAIDASVVLNTDFLPEPMDPQMLQQLLMAVMSEKMSYATFWYLLSQGELARPGITFEEELAEISRQSTLQPLVAGSDTGED